MSVESLKSGRVLFFVVAVALYSLAALISEEDIAPKDTFDAAYGSLLAAAVVFFALPQLLYRNRPVAFVLFCAAGVAVFALGEELFVDPLIMAADDPRRAFSLRGLRWAALNALFAAFSVAAIVAIFDNLESRRKLSALSELNKEAELAALKSQLNPHIVLNALNNLYSLTLEGSDQAPDAVLKLSKILQYSLYESKAGSASLEREIEILEAYVALQEIGVGERIEIDFKIEGAPGDRRIAPLLLLPIVENAFKHGSAVVGESPAKIDLRLSIDGQSITFDASNPYEPHSAGGVGGIGLDNLKSRLELLYPSRHALLVDPDGETFNVLLVLEGDPL